MDIKETREKLGWTQRDAASFFDTAQGTFCHWEVGRHSPPKSVVAIFGRLERVASASSNPAEAGRELLQAAREHGVEAGLEKLFRKHVTEAS